MRVTRISVKSFLLFAESLIRLNPTTIHTQYFLRPFFSSGVINKRGDFVVEATQRVQWPFLYQTLSTVVRFSIAT